MEVKNANGFTLIEVMIAIGIFSIGFLAVGLMQIGALNKTTTARQTTEAITIAESRVEQLRGLPFYADDNEFDDDGDGTDDNYDIPPDLSGDVAVNPHVVNVEGPYTVSWTVQDDVPLLPYPTDVKTDSAGNALTRSKTIRVWVTPDRDAADIRAEIEFAKYWG